MGTGIRTRKKLFKYYQKALWSRYIRFDFNSWIVKDIKEKMGQFRVKKIKIKQSS